MLESEQIGNFIVPDISLLIFPTKKKQKERKQNEQLVKTVSNVSET